MDDLLAAMYREAALEPEQLDDLQSRVRRYLQYSPCDRSYPSTPGGP
jgi:hypothetical protein